MNCPYPEHHSSGGGWGGPIAAIFTAMIAAVVLGPLLHWLEIALVCLGIGAIITAGWWCAAAGASTTRSPRAATCRGCGRRSSASSSLAASSRQLSRMAASICICTWVA
jgi:hypothetical protein